jgi:hypothetical protein
MCSSHMSLSGQWELAIHKIGAGFNRWARGGSRCPLVTLSIGFGDGHIFLDLALLVLGGNEPREPFQRLIHRHIKKLQA